MYFLIPHFLVDISVALLWVGRVRVFSWLTVTGYYGFSIREFLALDTPIIMFDKKGDYVVMKLKEVRSVISRLLYFLLQGGVRARADREIVATTLVWSGPAAAA